MNLNLVVVLVSGHVSATSDDIVRLAVGRIELLYCLIALTSLVFDLTGS